MYAGVLSFTLATPCLSNVIFFSPNYATDRLTNNLISNNILLPVSFKNNKQTSINGQTYLSFWDCFMWTGFNK